MQIPHDTGFLVRKTNGTAADAKKHAETKSNIIHWQDTVQWADPTLEPFCEPLSQELDDQILYSDFFAEMDRLEVRGKVYALCDNGTQQRLAYLANGFVLQNYRRTLETGSITHDKFVFISNKHLSQAVEEAKG